MSYRSVICATVAVSESELILMDLDYKSTWYDTKREKLDSLLYRLGLNVRLGYELQPVTQHRNRLNQVVVGARYVGQERLDPKWLATGLASQSAKAKALHNPTVDEAYARRGETESTQRWLEQRDARIKLHANDDEERNEEREV